MFDTVCNAGSCSLIQFVTRGLQFATVGYSWLQLVTVGYSWAFTVGCRVRIGLRIADFGFWILDFGFRLQFQLWPRR